MKAVFCVECGAPQPGLSIYYVCTRCGHDEGGAIAALFDEVGAYEGED